MDLVVVALASFGASALTLFSGFGLASLLTPIFVLFLPVPTAVASVAVVHLANNLYKLALVGRAADRGIVLRFGVAAAIAAVIGAAILAALVDVPITVSYDAFGHREVSLINVLVGLVLVVIAGAELRGAGRADAGEAPNRRLLMAGGAASGFLGGLTGSQGPLRAAVLLRAGLEPATYIATSVVCAVLVDIGRLVIYGSTFASIATVGRDAQLIRLVVVACLAAFAGATLGARFARRVTSTAVRVLAASLMVVVGTGLALGLI